MGAAKQNTHNTPNSNGHKIAQAPEHINYTNEYDRLVGELSRTVIPNTVRQQSGQQTKDD